MKIPDWLWNFAYERLARPLLFRFDPETAHHIVMTGLRVISASPFLLEALRQPSPASLSREVFGLRFPNPVGLAAGFDKNAEALPAWAALGFGFVEVGTVTAHPQPGNDKPRLFRYPELKVLINRMGFNNVGASAMAAGLQALRESGLWPAVPVGINIGKSKKTDLEDAASDYINSFARLWSFGDYIVINISSPNTPGLRSLQSKSHVSDLLRMVRQWVGKQTLRKPILVKIAPDLTTHEVDDIIYAVCDNMLSGWVVSNTTLDHSSMGTLRDESGGLSGAPLYEKSNRILSHVIRNSHLPVIASGGVMSSESAKHKLDLGASLVQVYTGYVYRGPALVSEICRALL